MRSLRRLALLSVAVSVAAAPIWATTLLRMNLDEMCQRADLVFMGTVLQVESGTVSVGGGELPTVTYTLRVDEAFQGTFDTTKGDSIATFTTIGKVPDLTVGNARRIPSLPTMPDLNVGRSYVLLTTPASSAGLSTTIGLGQGCFTLSGGGAKDLTAVNAFNNADLFSGMAAGLPASGPVSYSVLASQIQAAIGQ